MFLTKNVTKGLRELLSELGENYSIKVFDFEQCIYRDLLHFDIEISGANNNKKHKEFIIYVWKKRPHSEIVYKSEKINSVEKLKTELQKIENEYC